MIKMQFDYSDYHWQNCWCPMVFLLLTTLALIWVIVWIIKESKDPNLYKGNERVELISGYAEIYNESKDSERYRARKRSRKIAEYIASVLIMGVLMGTLIFDLANGGIFLLFEKEEHSIEMTGEIEGIIDPRHVYGKYIVDEKHVYGEFIFVDGQKYYLMTSGDLTEGDTVSMRVLPRSKFVLEIHRDD